MPVTNQYRFGKRSLLRPGTLFRAALGPLWEGRDESGGKVQRSMSKPGTYRFDHLVTKRTRVWIGAYSVSDGTFQYLYVGKKFRSQTCPGVVNRPYRISLLKPKRAKR